MNKFKNEVEKLLSEKKIILADLRDQYDRQDANHPVQCIQTMVAISNVIESIRLLEELSKKMDDGGESQASTLLNRK